MGFTSEHVDLKPWEKKKRKKRVQKWSLRSIDFKSKKKKSTEKEAL